MIQAFFLSLRQLNDKAILAVFVKSLLVTLVILAALVGGIWFGAHSAVRWLLGASDNAASLAALVTALGAIAVIWLLFRAVAIAVVGVFADEVVLAVERKHYPQAMATGKQVSFAKGAAMGLASASRAILVNVLLSPVYLGLLLTGVGTAAAFFLVNAWLLGRDLGDMVAVRHVPGRELPRWRSHTRIGRFALGAAATGLLLVPFVNLLAPVLGAAMATHLFHRRLAK